MNKAAVIALPIAVVVLFPLVAILVVAGVGGINQATACTPTTGLTNPGTDTGGISGGVSTPISGQITMAQANIPMRSGPAGFRSSMPKVLSKRPDVVTLNEQFGRSLTQVKAAAPGYDAYRDPTPDHGPGGSQASDEIVLWKAAVWKQVDAGRTKLMVNNEGGVTRARYATWVLLQRPTDGAIIAVVAVHMPINPAVYGPDKPTRQAEYGAGMATLGRLVATLGGHGPVFVGGDFNVRPAQTQAWTAPTVMKTAGFSFYSADLDYLFYPRQHGVTLAAGWNGPMASDHPWISARFNMNGAAASPAPANTGAQTGTGARGGTVQAADVTGNTSAATARPATTTTTASAASVAGRVRPDANGNVRIGSWTLNADQLHNAQTMIATASGRGGTAAAVVIITAALTESGLSTNPGTLGGAYGILQQTPSAGWGSYTQVMDVSYATNAFLDHLAKISGWRTMPPWQAAQAVQRSGAGAATSGRANYGPKVPQAQAIVAALGGGAIDVLASCPAGGTSSADLAGVKGAGSFTPNTQYAYVGPYAPGVLVGRMQQIMARNGSGGNLDPFFGTEPDSSWFRDCQHFVANLDGRASSGYGSAQAAWSSLLATGAAHPAASPDGMRPPVGAWLYFAPNHVVVYLGNNLVAGTDTWGTGTAKIGPVSDITNGTWHLPYLGWAAPWGTTSGVAKSGTSA